MVKLKYIIVPIYLYMTPTVNHKSHGQCTFQIEQNETVAKRTSGCIGKRSRDV